MNCKKDCKWLSYDYEIDDFGNLLDLVQYKCLKYEQTLGVKMEKCPKCIDADKSRTICRKKDRKFYE